jgi:hypothetical protein
MKSTLNTCYYFCILLVQGCQDNDDTSATPANLAVQDFIWKGLNQYYLWQADVPNLADDRATQAQLNVFYQAIRFLKTI